MNSIMLSSKMAITMVFSLLLIRLFALILSIKFSVAIMKVQMRITVTISKPLTMLRVIFSRSLIMLAR